MRFTVKQLLVWTALIALVMGTSMRGEHLFGWTAGILYLGLSTIFIIILRHFFLPQHSHNWQCPTMGCMFGTGLFAMLMFPHAFDGGPIPGLWWFCATRTIQVQANEIVNRHPRFSDLEIQCEYVGYPILTIHGSLKNEIDMMILRENISRYCPSIDLRMVKWKITLEETRFDLDNWDHELYASNSKYPIYDTLRTQTDASWDRNQ